MNLGDENVGEEGVADVGEEVVSAPKSLASSISRETKERAEEEGEALVGIGGERRSSRSSGIRRGSGSVGPLEGKKRAMGGKRGLGVDPSPSEELREWECMLGGGVGRGDTLADEKNESVAARGDESDTERLLGVVGTSLGGGRRLGTEGFEENGLEKKEWVFEDDEDGSGVSRWSSPLSELARETGGEMKESLEGPGVGRRSKAIMVGSRSWSLSMA